MGGRLVVVENLHVRAHEYLRTAQWSSGRVPLVVAFEPWSANSLCIRVKQ